MQAMVIQSTSLPCLSPEIQALEAAQVALVAARARAMPVEMAISLVQVAHCYQGLNELEAAHQCLAQALQWAACSGSADTEVRVLCELTELGCDLAEAWRAAENEEASLNALDTLRDHAFQAAQRAASVADTDWEVKVLLRVSDVLERCGDHQDACTLQARAMRLMVGESGALPPPDLHGLRQPMSD
jgi:tetratricopeptide (TPR) repeat protein